MTSHMFTCPQVFSMKRVFKEVDTSLPTKEQLKQLQPMMKSTNNRRVLRSLFLEAIGQDILDLEITKPIFTLKDYNVIKDDGNGNLITYWSLKNVYFSYDHIPGFEYEFAKDVFNDWDHWVKLTESSSIAQDAITAWREELTVRLQAKAFSSLFKTAMFEGSKGTPAARFLADRGWEVKRGRPSKDEVAKERKIAAGVDKMVQEDMDRLGLKLVKNT